MAVAESDGAANIFVIRSVITAIGQVSAGPHSQVTAIVFPFA